MSIVLYELVVAILALVALLSFKRNRVILVESIQHFRKRTEIDIDIPTNGAASEEKRYMAKSWVNGQTITNIY